MPLLYTRINDYMCDINVGKIRIKRLNHQIL